MIIAVSRGIAQRYGERIRALDHRIALVWPEGERWSGDVQAAEAVYFSEDFWTSGESRTILPQLFTLPNLRWFHSFSAGVGHIGGEVARLAKAFRMRVVGCRRRRRPVRNVDEFVPPERLHELLAQAHFVVLALPLTLQTEGLISESELRAMRQDAWLINIARGQVVNEPALVRALKDGSIGGACLDVFQEEPLPEESELWSLPNVIVTPHNSGRSPLNQERGTEIFLDNLGRYVAGKPLRNRVRASDL